MPVVSADLPKRPAADELWELVSPLLPSFAARTQGGGTAQRDERAVVDVRTDQRLCLAASAANVGTSSATTHRRFTVWTKVGLWRRLHRAVLDELGARGEGDWTSAIVGAASVRARRGIGDEVESGRSRQEGHQAARVVRCPGHPTRRRRVRCEHARKSCLQAAHPRYPRRSVQPGTTTAPTCQTPCGQGVLLRRPPQLVARAWARRAHHAARHRVRRTPWSAPLEDRAVDRLALRLPPPDYPIRTKGLALPRLPRLGRCHDLLQNARETCHVRRPLRSVSC